jgi:hypothetical protein
LNGGFDGAVTGQTNGVTETFTAPTGAPGGVTYVPTAPWVFSYSCFNTVIASTCSGAFAGGSPIVASGFATQAGIGALTFTESGTVTTGSVKDITADVFIQYTYDTASSSTPEPVSMILFGTGLLGLSIVGRKKFARK